MTVKCPVCENECYQLRLKIYKCSSCRLEFAHPMPSEKELKDFYSKYSNPRAGSAVVRKNSELVIKNLEKYGLSRNSRLLDFGCGEDIMFTGNPQNWIGYDKYTKPYMPDGKFDFITIIGVLEHLTNPIETLKDLVSRLNQNGKIALTTVGTETGIPYQYKIPEHVTWWNVKSIDKLFKKTGMNVLEFSPYFMFQDPKVYIDCVLKAGKVPEELRKLIHFDAHELVYVPTNEIFAVGTKSET